MTEEYTDMPFVDYTIRDRELVDYQFYRLPEYPEIGFRGPSLTSAELEQGNYFTVLGAAQTLGVYVQTTFVEPLAQKLGLPGLNLGLGGANPQTYINHPGLIARANRGKFVILQVMTARSQANSRMQPIGLEQYRDLRTGEVSFAGGAWQKILDTEPDKAPGHVKECQENWRQGSRQLLAKLKVPVILFYFSHRPVDEEINYHAKTWKELWGGFPQFVDIASIEEVAALCSGYAECLSQRNYGHELRSRFTGELVEIDYADVHPALAGIKETTNTYYPSPEMHQDAVAPLYDCVKRLRLV